LYIVSPTTTVVPPLGFDVVTVHFFVEGSRTTKNCSVVVVDEPPVVVVVVVLEVARAGAAKATSRPAAVKDFIIRFSSDVVRRQRPIRAVCTVERRSNVPGRMRVPACRQKALDKVNRSRTAAHAPAGWLAGGGGMAPAPPPWHGRSMGATLDTPAGHLTLQFLAWIGEAPRGYGEVMDAWRTSCPRLSIWEDALRDGLVEVRNGRGPMRERRVAVTERGRALLERETAFTAQIS
jgi:hypothetical protein